MAKRRLLSEEALQELKAAMKAARTPDELRRMQCVWLPAALGIGRRQVAAALDWPVRAVREGRSRYLRHGASGFQDHRRRSSSPPGSPEALEAALKRARTVDHFRRIQCVWLRARLGLDENQVAVALGWRPRTVNEVQCLYRRHGLAAFVPPPTGEPALAEDASRNLRAAMKAARTVPEFCRAQCLFMRLVLGLSSSLVARSVGWRQSSVAHLHRQYLHEGDAALDGPGRGGARRHLLTREKETEVLRNLARQSSGGGLLTFAFIHNAVETAAGRPVKAATVQAMLDRHGWSRDALVITPRQTRQVEAPHVHEAARPQYEQAGVGSARARDTDR